LSERARLGTTKERVVSWLDRRLERSMAIDRTDGGAVQRDLERHPLELHDETLSLHRERR
jgi:hypothetical protein